MFGKLLAFVFSFFAVILAVPLMVAVAVFLFKFDLRSFMNLHPLGTALLAAGYAFLWIFSFFALQDYFLVWKPNPQASVIGKKELIEKMENAFKRTFDGKSLYDVFRSDDDRMAITWSSSINYFQVVAGGRMGKKRVVVLSFDEKTHEAYFLMKDRDWKWSLSAGRFDFSMNYSAGIFAEISTDVVPSLTFDRDGGFAVEVKKLSYNTNELWLPIQKTLLASGWTIRGGMIPGWSYRLVLAVPFALVIFLIFYFFPASSASITSATGAKPSPSLVTGGDRETYKKSEAEAIAKAGRLRSARELEPTLNGFMTNIPQQYFGDYEHAFVAYARAYLEKDDQDPAFAARLNAFAKERGLKISE